MQNDYQRPHPIQIVIKLFHKQNVGVILGCRMLPNFGDGNMSHSELGSEFDYKWEKSVRKKDVGLP